MTIKKITIIDKNDREDDDTVIVRLAKGGK